MILPWDLAISLRKAKAKGRISPKSRDLNSCQTFWVEIIREHTKTTNGYWCTYCRERSSNVFQQSGRKINARDRWGLRSINRPEASKLTDIEAGLIKWRMQSQTLVSHPHACWLRTLRSFTKQKPIIYKRKSSRNKSEHLFCFYLHRWRSKTISKMPPRVGHQ